MKNLLLAALVAACSSPKPQPSSPEPMPVATPAVVEPAKQAPKQEPVEDPYLWLEDVGAEKSLTWAREQNAKAKAELETTPEFVTTRDRIRGILDSKDKTPYVQKRGNL